MEQWGMNVSREDTYVLYAYPQFVAALYVYNAPMFMHTEFLWTHDAWELSKTQSKYKVSMLFLQLNKQGQRQP